MCFSDFSASLTSSATQSLSSTTSSSIFSMYFQSSRITFKASIYEPDEPEFNFKSRSFIFLLSISLEKIFLISDTVPSLELLSTTITSNESSG